MSRLTDDELTHLEMFGANDVPSRMSRRIWSLVKEVRERRAADLTSFERMALATIRDDIAEYEHHDINMVRVLDKLLADSTTEAK